MVAIFKFFSHGKVIPKVLYFFGAIVIILQNNETTSAPSIGPHDLQDPSPRSAPHPHISISTTSVQMHPFEQDPVVECTNIDVFGNGTVQLGKPEFGRREKTTNVSWVHATKRSSTSHVPPSNCGASKHSNRCIHRWVRCWSATISPSAASHLPLPTQPDGAHVDEPADELQGY